MQTLRRLQQLGHSLSHRYFYFSALTNEEVRALELCPVRHSPHRREQYENCRLDLLVDGIIVDAMIDGQPAGLKIALNAVRCNVPCVVVVHDSIPPLIQAELGTLACVHAELIAIGETPTAAHQQLLQLVFERRSETPTSLSHGWLPLPEYLTGALVAC